MFLRCILTFLFCVCLVGYKDSDDDENVLARKLQRRQLQEKLVDTPYFAVREAESHDKLGVIAYIRILRMMKIGLTIAFYVMPAIVCLSLAIFKGLEEPVVKDFLTNIFLRTKAFAHDASGDDKAKMFEEDQLTFWGNYSFFIQTT